MRPTLTRRHAGSLGLVVLVAMFAALIFDRGLVRVMAALRGLAEV